MMAAINIPVQSEAAYWQGMTSTGQEQAQMLLVIMEMGCWMRSLLHIDWAKVIKF